MSGEAPDPGLAKQCYLAMLANPAVEPAPDFDRIARLAFEAAAAWVKAAKEAHDGAGR